jgi:hypothetical protein
MQIEADAEVKDVGARSRVTNDGPCRCRASASLGFRHQSWETDASTLTGVP